MKSCPTCKRTFDDTMSFCLVDGSVLSAPFDANATQPAQNYRDSDPPPTMMNPTASADRAIQAPKRYEELPQTVSSPTAVPGDVSTKTKREEKPSQPAMKTIAAPPPEPALGGSRRETHAAATNPDRRLTQSPSDGSKRLIGLAVAAVLLVALAVGALWFIRSRNALQSKAASHPAKPTESKTAPAGQSFTESVNGTEIKMISVSGGTFQMGSPGSEAGRDQDEGPQTNVTVQSFYMSKYEITQAQYKAAMGVNPASFKGDDLPVDSVSWNDAVEFCRKLSALSGKQYRLPTEAEWEYSARAGTNGPYAGNLESMAWYDANSGNQTHPVGQKEPNGFGLYDMYGNVWEWCESKYMPYPYRATDGREDLQGSGVRVLRGGSWKSAAKGCRSAYRRRVVPEPNSSGFRIVLGSS